jgi:hypothetical protein
VNPEHPEQHQVPPPAQSSSVAQPARAGQPVLPDLSDLVGDGNANRERRSLRQLPPRVLLVGAAVLGALVLAGGGFVAGRAAASTGPSTLADAVQQAQAGKLPCGSSSGTGGAFLTAICSGNGGRLGGGRFGGDGTEGGGTAQGGTGRGAGGIFGPGSVTGTITSVSGNTMQVQTRAGTITVTVPSSAEITATTTGSSKDLVAGKTVVITATGDSSGTNQTASRVLVLPQTN